MGSVIGGIIGYFIGAALFASIGQPIIDFLHLQTQFLIVGEYFKNNAFLAISGAAFTPIPYKVFTIAAGFWNVALGVFIAASIVGRGLRFFIEGAALYWFGAKIASLIDKYFTLLSWAVLIIIIILFIILNFLL